MRRVLPVDFPFNLIALTLALSAVATFAGGIIHFYQQGVFLEAISYVSDERIMNDIVAGLLEVPATSTLWGVHAFGDYLLPHYWVTLTNPWLEDGTGVINYLPSSLILHEALLALDYRSGVVVFLALMLVSLLTPLVYAFRSYPWSIRILGIVVLGLLSGPAIASLDRGNTQGFVPLLLFGFALAIIRARWKWAVLFLIAAASIKIYPLVLVLLLVALRKWWHALAAVVGTILVALVTLPLVSANLWPTAQFVFTNPFTFADRDFGSFMANNVSFAGGVAHLFTMVGATSGAEWIAANGVAVGLVYLVAVAPLLWFTQIVLWQRAILGMALTTGIMPLVYPYALNWVIAATSLAVLMSARSSSQHETHSPESTGHVELPRGQWIPLLVSLALLSAALPVYLPGSSEAGFAVGLSGMASLIAMTLLPLGAWWSVINRKTRSHGTTMPGAPSSMAGALPT